MTVIYKKDTARITVGVAKAFIVQALPEQEKGGLGGYVELEMKDGEVVSVDVDTLRLATAKETLDMTLLELCQSEGFEPRMKLSPARGGYQLRQADDDCYMVTHAQFVKLAEAYSLTVVVGDEPAATPAPVGADGDAPAKRSNKKPSWATVAMPYMKTLFTAGHYKSASMFYDALKRRAGESDSPFKLVNRELYCTEAGTTVSDGSLGNVWPQIRAH